MAPAAARSMLAIMRGVTEQGGTAKQAAIEGYTVGGKTGTAQKVANGHYDPDQAGCRRSSASCRRRIRGWRSSSSSTSRRAATWAARWRRRSSRRSPSRRCATCTCAPTVTVAARGKDAGKGAAGDKPAPGGASAAADADDVAANEGTATELPLDDESLGDDPALAEAWDEIAGAEAGRGERRAAAERLVVPDFAGMSLGQAIRAARRSGVELAFDDPDGRATGVALRQRPAPGPAPRGVVCRVAFGRRE